MKQPATSKKPSQIPHFKSYEEEADFWDTHSPLDFPGEFEEVDDIVFVRPLSIERPDARAEFVHAMADLPDEQRQALAFDLLGLRIQEVSTIMGWTPAKCRRVIREAKRNAKIAA